MSVHCFLLYTSDKYVLELDSAPEYLRVVYNGKTKRYNALDKPDDELSDDEDSIAYRRKGCVQTMVICKRNQQCETQQYANYEPTHEQPDAEVFASWSRWQSWCAEQTLSSRSAAEIMNDAGVPNMLAGRKINLNANNG